MELGNFGESKSVREGVRELRIDFGPGYRVYYGIDEGRIVLLLGSGTKRDQSRDTRNAIDRWTSTRNESRRGRGLALTREYRETVVERLRADREFTAALFSEAISAFVQGDRETTLSILRDLVHAHISFKTLSEQTGFDEKGLHRMLSSRGNPTTQNLSTLLHTIETDLDLRIEVKAV